MNGKDKGYHRLVIWRKGRKFVKLVYQKTERFPRSEVFGLQSQIRRAIISFLLNIVEGQRKISQKEFLRHLDIADGSLAEVEACLEIAVDLEFISQTDYKELEDKRRELAKMLTAFIKKVKKDICS